MFLKTCGGFLLLVWVTAVSAQTDNSAYMEAGAVLVGQASADYRGSKHYQPYALPLPYFIYQGPILKADKDGVRGEFWANHRFEFNASVDGSLNGNSDNNTLREGMPELDSAVEVGPSLNMKLTGETFSEGWSLRFPLRAVFTISRSGFDYIGYLFNPRLNWRKSEVIGDWRLSFNTGILYADKQFHRYYYDVKNEYVTDDRPYYRAQAGYSGAFGKFSIYRAMEKWRVGVSFRYDYLGGVKFIDSPLVETKHYGSVSVGVVRTFWAN